MKSKIHMKNYWIINFCWNHAWFFFLTKMLEWLVCSHICNATEYNHKVCLFWMFSSHSRIFHLCEDVTITGEGLQILTYARYSWQLSSEGSLTFHTYCNMGHPFIMVISEDPWHHTYFQAFSSGAVTIYMYQFST